MTAAGLSYLSPLPRVLPLGTSEDASAPAQQRASACHHPAAKLSLWCDVGSSSPSTSVLFTIPLSWSMKPEFGSQLASARRWTGPSSMTLTSEMISASSTIRASHATNRLSQNHHETAQSSIICGFQCDRCIQSIINMAQLRCIDKVCLL